MYDGEYIYGFYVERKGDINILEQMVDSESVVTPEIVNVYAYGSGSMALSAEGELYAFGGVNYQKQSVVPIKIAENISLAVHGLNESPSIVDKNGDLYFLRSKYDMQL